MKKSFIISNFMLKMWMKEILKILNTKTKQAVSVIVALFLIFIASLVGYQLTSLSLTSFFSGDPKSLTLLIVSMYFNASIFTMVLFILFKTVATDYDRLWIQLSWFPIKRYEKNLGYFLLFSNMVIGLVILFISLIIVPASVMQGAGVRFIFAFLVGLFLQSSFMLFLIHFLYNFISFIVRICKIPFTKLLSLFLIVMIVVSYVLEIFNINKLLTNFTDFDYNLMYFLTPVFLGLMGELALVEVNLYIILGGYILVAIASYFSLFLMDPESEKKSLKFLQFIPMPRSKFGALIVKEVKCQSRNEENLLNFILIILLTIMFSLKFNVNQSLIVLFILSGTTGIVALNSFGNDLKMNTSYKMFGLSESKVAMGKWVGLCILSFVQLIIYCLILMYVPESLLSTLQIILIAMNSVALFYVAGIVFPIDKKILTQEYWRSVFFCVC